MSNTEKSGANAVGHKNVITAVATAMIDRFSNKGLIPPLKSSDRLDGKTCLVTGANSGLGKAVAIQLAQRGGHVIMACRGGHPQAGQDVKIASASEHVEMMHVDLADLNSVNALCDELRDRQVELDIIVLNAGLMPLNARKSAQGYELMFAIHFLANRLLVDRWLNDGVINVQREQNDPARIIFVSSEAHQSSETIDFNNFAAFVDFGIKDGMKHYASSKLHMCTYANELSKRLNPDNNVAIAIHALCPGPVASNIARESPGFLKPILSPIFKLFFRSPEAAAEPVIYLACSDDIANRTGVYLHMMREKLNSEDARNSEYGQLLWEKSSILLKDFVSSSEVKDSRPSA